MSTKNATGLDAVGKPAETATMKVYNPYTDEPLTDDEGNEMWIEIYGSDSAQYRAVQHEQANRRLEKMQRSGGRPSLSAEQQEANSLELLVRCTKSWYLILGGKVPEATEANVRQVYQDYRWLREQVDIFMHDRKAFLTN